MPRIGTLTALTELSVRAEAVLPRRDTRTVLAGEIAKPQLRRLTLDGGLTLPMEIVEAVTAGSEVRLATDMCPGTRPSS